MCQFPIGHNEKVTEVTLDLSQAAATYDAMTAFGDVLIELISFYVSIVGGGLLTSVSVQTDDTTVQQLLTVAEGAVANLVAQQTLAFAYAKMPIRLQSGKKIQYTIASTGASTGQIKFVVKWMQISSGARLT